jgi:nitrite reductase/ring-hydroxylating ferredoxin subunit
MNLMDGVDAGSVRELEARGMLVTKVGTHGVCVVWHAGRAYAVDDRCPHLGFPLHRGSVEDGLLTCHWHHARFDLCSGGTLDPFADDARTYPVEIRDGRVLVLAPPPADQSASLLARLDEGLEQGLSLVMAKAVLALLEGGVPAAEIVRRGVAFGTGHRREGWGSGLTVLVAMANLLPLLEPGDRPLALVHGLAFVARDTRGHPDRFPLAPLATADGCPGGGVELERLAGWYRRFIDTRTDEAAERALATAITLAGDADDPSRRATERFMMAAVTDHVFIDGGHTLDFTNQAFEAVALLGWPAAASVLPTVTAAAAGARRSEEEGSWRHPHDLAGLARAASQRLASSGQDILLGPGVTDDEIEAMAWRLLGAPRDDDPAAPVAALLDGLEAGLTPEQAGRAVALAAGLRITRFHVQNDHGDWDVVHHGFTYANALHQALIRGPSVELLRGAVHGVLKIFLDRFLNVPAARPPSGRHADLDDLPACWDEQGQVDRAGGIVYGWVKGGGDPATAISALGHALVSEDAEFHWFQTVEAAARQATAWPAGSEPQALLLAGAARFLAAHTPTRRELPQLVSIATRLRRGENLFEEV